MATSLSASANILVYYVVYYVVAFYPPLPLPVTKVIREGVANGVRKDQRDYCEKTPCCLAGNFQTGP